MFIPYYPIEMIKNGLLPSFYLMKEVINFYVQIIVILILENLVLQKHLMIIVKYGYIGRPLTLVSFSQ